MTKLQKNAKRLDRFFLFAQRLTVAGCIFGGIVVFFTWYLWIGDPDIWELLYTTLDFGSIEFLINPSVSPAPNSFFWYLLLNTLVGIIQLPVLYMTFGAIRGILGLMAEGTPFHENIISFIKKLGWLAIAHGIINIAGSFTLQGNFLKQYDLEAIFLSDAVTKVTTTYSIDLSFVLFAVILFLLAEVFRYGLELQTLSDETL